MHIDFKSDALVLSKAAYLSHLLLRIAVLKILSKDVHMLLIIHLLFILAFIFLLWSWLYKFKPIWEMLAFPIIVDHFSLPKWAYFLLAHLIYLWGNQYAHWTPYYLLFAGSGSCHFSPSFIQWAVFQPMRSDVDWKRSTRFCDLIRHLPASLYIFSYSYKAQRPYCWWAWKHCTFCVLALI